MRLLRVLGVPLLFICCARGQLTLQVPGNVYEKDGHFEVVVQRSSSGAELITDYRVLWGSALATNDLSNPVGEVKFGATETNTVIRLDLIRDGLVEPNKHLTVQVHLTGPWWPYSAEVFLTDEQQAAGWDHSFPIIKNVSAVLSLQDESLLVMRRELNYELTAFSRINSNGVAFPNFGWRGPLRTIEFRAAHLLDDGAILLAGNFELSNWGGRALYKTEAKRRTGR
jgi:hypothetical protein